MKQKKIIISFLFGTLCLMACELGKQNPRTAVSKLDYEGKAIIDTPGIFTDCTYGLDQSISDHAPVIYGRTATWNIASAASHVRQYTDSGDSFFYHKFRILTDLDDKQKPGPKDGTLVDVKNNPVIKGEKSEFSDDKINEQYAHRLTALATKIKELFNNHDLESMALQEVPEDQASLDHFITALKPLKYIASVRAGQKKAPDVALVVDEKSTMDAQIPSTKLRAQAFCDHTTKNCIVSAHIIGARLFVKKEGLSEEQIWEKEAEKIKVICKELEEFTEKLRELSFEKITYLGDFNVSAQKIKEACKWDVAPIIKSYEGDGSACNDNNGTLTKENIDILLEFAPKK